MSKGKVTSKVKLSHKKPLQTSTESELKAVKRNKKRVSQTTIDVLEKSQKRRKLNSNDAKPTTFLNESPHIPLDVYVFGCNDQGQLGLGPDAGSKAVKRPRLNAKLLSVNMKVVQVVAGGMHGAALTADNRILTWGVNDQGALGRDTTWTGGLIDMDEKMDDSDSESEEVLLNPRESTPTEIDNSAIPKGTRFVQIAASDNATFALTKTGDLYGWGTFINSDGISNFTSTVKVQQSPVRVLGLSNLKRLATGDNHVLALDHEGAVWTWGTNDSGQLGRLLDSKAPMGNLSPGRCLNGGVAEVGCGPFHSFAVTNNGRLYAWGLNNFGQTGIPTNMGGNESCVKLPSQVKALSNEHIMSASGGNKHSVVVSKDGKILTWGILGTFVTGHEIDGLPETSVMKDEFGRRLLLKAPTQLPNLPPIAYADSGTEHCIAVAVDGRAFSWGFGESYRTGLGIDEDVRVPTLIDNTATRGKLLVHAGAGGAFSVLTGISEF